MAKKVQSSRCPLQGECERTCKYQGKEIQCDYYRANARPGLELYDQEEARHAEWKAAQAELDAAQPEEETAADAGQTSGREITTKNGKVVYLAGPNGVTEKIKMAMYESARQFVYIGFLLWEVQEYGYYLEGGYRDVYEYAEAELNFKRSSTKSFIAICKEFSTSETKTRANGAFQMKGQSISMTLQPRYE